MHTKGSPTNDAVEDAKPKILGDTNGPIQIEESKTQKNKKNRTKDA